MIYPRLFWSYLYRFCIVKGYARCTDSKTYISNPKLFPTARTTDAFHCHLDLLPTIAELTGVPEFAQYGKGVSIVPILKNLVDSVQDSILFTYDDNFFLPADVPGGHIRAIRQGDWVYAVYYSENGSNFEYEMYNLKDDPGQLHNLLYKNLSPEIAVEANRLHHKLKEKIDQAACCIAYWLSMAYKAILISVF